MKIAVIDGQGGGLGKAIIEKIRNKLGGSVEVIALGTNVIATSQMLKAGANKGATGENAIIVNVPKVDVLVGAVGIIAADSMMGELTANMANAIARSECKKILIPLNKCNLIISMKEETLPNLIENAVNVISDCIERKNCL